MYKNYNNFAFIDNTNLYKGVQMLGWKLDFSKFRKLLAERYGVSRAYMFMGYIAGNQDMYRDLWCSILLKREARSSHVFIEEMKSKLELK